jgi:AcrR family transcriptional regulator
MADAEVRGAIENRRVRMAPGDRERMILEEAVRFFALHGFGAQIRDLAAEAGISQGLVYRYFRSKRELLERVYEHNFIKRWDDSWEEALKDRREPLDARLIRFYSNYLTAIDDPDWIRLVMYSGLERNDLTRRYIRTQVERLLQTIALECRTASGSTASGAVSEMETEAVWHLHSTFIYYLVRKHIFAIETTGDRDALVRIAVRSFLEGVGAALAGDTGN